MREDGNLVWRSFRKGNIKIRPMLDHFPIRIDYVDPQPMYLRI